MRVKRQTPVLDDHVSAILIGGWMAEPPSGPQHGFGETLSLFTEGDGYIAALWAQHETYLRELAKRWSMEPAWNDEQDAAEESGASDSGPLYFFAEWVANERRCL